MISLTDYVPSPVILQQYGVTNKRFITRSHDLLCKEHQAVTGRELKTFFDTKAIEEGEQWKTLLGQGLRDSRLFLAFLSNNYLKSPVCKWDWQHYLLIRFACASPVGMQFRVKSK